MGHAWTDAGDRRAHARLLAVLLALLALLVVIPTASGALGSADVNRPENLVPPSVSGDPRVGGTLTCDRGRWDDTPDAPYEYQYFWVRGFGDPIDGAESATYVVTGDDADVELLCVVHALNGQLDSYQESDVVVGRLPEPRSAPVLTGPSRLGGQLRCTRGVWDDRDLPAYATRFAWLRDDEVIDGAETDRYTVTAADVGHEIACEVGGAGGSVSYSPVTVPTAPIALTPPSVSGAPRIGGVLSCSRGTWDDEGVTAYSVEYRWLRDGDPIALATSATYTVSLGDAGHALSCGVTAAGLTEAASASVAVTDPVNRNVPRVSGDPHVGRTVTCLPGTWDGPDYSFDYAWQRSGTQVASGATYVVAAADVGAPLTCRATAHGRSSATSVAVVPTAPASLSLPAVDGVPRLGRDLTCSAGTWDDTYAYAFSWVRDGAVVGTGATRTVLAADLAHELRCRVVASGVSTVDSRPVAVPTPRSLSAPAISGDPVAGQVLACGNGGWDADYAYTYAWFRGDGTALDTGAGHTVAAGETALFCRVTAAGLTTAQSATVTVTTPAGSTPENRTPPAVTGTALLYSTVSCSPGTWNGSYNYAYRWLRDGAPIAGATQNQYSLDFPDLGHALRCEVSVGAVAALSQAVTVAAPVALAPPAIAGEPRARATLRCSTGSWDAPYAFVVQWFRDGVAAGNTFDRALTAADIGHQFTCRVEANGTGVTSTSAAITVQPPRNVSPPSVEGDPHLGRVLTCDPGRWDATDYALSYRWTRDGTALETVATHTVVAADVAKALTCEVRAEGLSTAVSAPVTANAPSNLTAPAISGTPRIGGTLTCGDGTWNDTYAITKRWLRAGAPIATGATYTVVKADVGKALTCEATAAGLTAATSDAVEPTAPIAVHRPQIEGDRRIGTTLSCTPGDWDGTYALTYRWLRDGAPAGTGTTLAVGKADVGAEFVCEVTADGLTAAASDVTVVDPPQSLSAPKVTGAPQLRGTLECSRGLWDDTAAAPYAVTYQWLKDDVAIAGATSARLGPFGRADLDAEYRCEVTAEALTTVRGDAVEVLPPTPVRNWPSIDGSGNVGRALTCEKGDWNDSEALPYSYTYRWERRNDSPWRPIPGADGTTYVVGANDVNAELRCIVTAEGDWPVESYSTYGSWPPVETSLTQLDDSVVPGAENGYRVTLTNPNPISVGLQYVYLSLPDGFKYVTGSTKGATTADPDGTTGFLRWRNGLSIEANGSIAIDVTVKVSDTPGHYFASAGGQTPGYNVWISSDSGAIVSVAPPLDTSTCTVLGTPGNDVLVGTDGNDVICGLGGDDRLDGKGGDDLLLGGDGDDILLAGPGADVMRGGGGLDTVNYASRTTPVRVTLGDDGNVDKDFDHTVADDGTYAHVDSDDDGDIDDDDPWQLLEHDDVDADVEIVRGGRGADHLVGSENDDELYGGAGADLLDPQGGANLADSGDGDDTVFAGWSAHERVFCGNGFDSYRADADNDLIVGCEFYMPSEGATLRVR
ncbi:calcium-binding protein [Solirubrobacter soli]|uniref:calcium-binding protein n=1 Tax=Solirubrobacter soli TaxID=363832 RepID=UPI000407FDD0|nr:calcium-binding protein [Solirubrobacter soli]